MDGIKGGLGKGIQEKQSEGRFEVAEYQSHQPALALKQLLTCVY